MDFKQALELTNRYPTYLLVGNGSKNQFHSINPLDKWVDDIISMVEDDALFLYFGDSVDEKEPTIGYVFYLLDKKCQEKKKPIHILGIQREDQKEYPMPNFVSKGTWYHKYGKDCKDKCCKWGGIDPDTEAPCSNTRAWVELEQKGADIRKIFILGGGRIVEEEAEIAAHLGIDIGYFSAIPKYKDGVEFEIKGNQTNSNRFGKIWEIVMNIYINEDEFLRTSCLSNRKWTRLGKDFKIRKQIERIEVPLFQHYFSKSIISDSNNGDVN